MADEQQRHVGVHGATLVGLGGIIGGGLLILSGTAFGMAGPAAIAAFALNCIVAWITAMSVAEISVAFPQSGGAYTFAKKVLSVRFAFAVGWVLWFAYIVAGVLYALSFAQFTVILVRGVCDAAGWETAWLGGRGPVLLLGTLATAGYSIGLVRQASGGGQWVTIAKVVLFLALIAAGAVALVRQPLGDIPHELSPFFSGGIKGLVAAMGVTFISLQGFEMVSAIAGEIKEPTTTIPKAIFRSLGISICIYLPIMFLIPTAGVDGGPHISQLAAHDPDTVMAIAARGFMGTFGYWFVVVAIAMATLSALQSNLLTASRVAFAMAHDHTLPHVLEERHPTRGTPIMAIYATALATVGIMFMIPDLTSAGAAASLIFLAAFALTHFTGYLARKRGGLTVGEGSYQTPWFPVIPLVGGIACAGLAVFQALVVPEAGKILFLWLGLGVMLYFALFKGRAEAADASAEAMDPRLNRLRGKNPLVLLPVANPKNATSLVEIANALAPSEFARVLLLSVIRAPRKSGDAITQLADAQEAFRQALGASYAAGHAPEALITAAAEPWPEIRRIAAEHDCESLLVGLPRNVDAKTDREIEALLNEVDCDVAMMRAPDDWRIGNAKRVLVPIAGKSDEHELRVRLLATISREAPRELVFLSVVPTTSTDDDVASATKVLGRLSRMKIPGTLKLEVVRSDDPAGAIITESATCDLVVLGMRKSRAGTKQVGTINKRIAAEATCAVMLLSRRQQAQVTDLIQPIRDVANIVPLPFLAKRAADDE